MRKTRFKKGGYYSLLFFHQGRREFAIFRLDEIRDDDQIIDGPVLTQKNGVIPRISTLVAKPLTSQTRFLKREVESETDGNQKFFCQGILSTCNQVMLEVLKKGFQEMNPKHAEVIKNF